LNLPNLFIVGAPKCGSTSLHAYLGQHDDVFMSEPKELNFFSREELLNQSIYYDKAKIISDELTYQSIFSDVDNHKIIGESSVSYLFYKAVPPRLYEFNKEANIIILLRNPIDRAYSHYLMDWRLGLVNRTFEQIFEDQGHSDSIYFQQYFELGLYSEQVKRYLDLFKGQVEIILYEDLRDHLTDVMKKLSTKLQISEFKKHEEMTHNAYKQGANKLIDYAYRYKWLRNLGKTVLGANSSLNSLLFKQGSKPTLNEDMVKNLQKFYRADIVRTQGIIDRDLSHWMQ
jgi:hypothetical protein